MNLCICYAKVQALVDKKTNFVLLFADDIGWGDFGANWEPNHKFTPSLNALAEQGLRLTDFHSGAAVCTPSRASLLTGRLGLRTGVIKNFVPSSVAGLPLNETIIPEVLRQHGYLNGMVGKWHLGTTKQFHPMSRGFDYYYGLPYSDDMGCVDEIVYNKPMCKQCGKKPSDTNPKQCYSKTRVALPLYENYTIIEQPADLYTLSDGYSKAADKIITEATTKKQPFFLYVAFAHTHVPLAPPRDSENKHCVFEDVKRYGPHNRKNYKIFKEK